MIDSAFPLYLTVFIATFLITVLVERSLIPILQKSGKQPIYEGGPRWHISKSGTPTMGGVAFLVGITVSLFCAALIMLSMGKREGAISLFLCLGFSVLNSLVGIIDDLRKLKRRQNEGLKPYQKLTLQSICATVFLILRYVLLDAGTALSFSFGEVDAGLLYYPLAFIILLGITNCANLTDGIDGLATGVAFAVGVSLFYISGALNTEASFISSALMGGACAFLIFNINPARIFMGDTGSLFLGALGSACAVALGNPLLIVFIGGIYVIEGISVILQVFYYKLTKKRLFKMAPFHHHLEKCGWGENKICISAIIVTLLLSIPAFIFYLP